MEAKQTVQKQIVEQERFYYDRYGFVLLLVLMLLGLAVGIVGLIILLRSTAVPPPAYLPATALGELIEEAPLDKGAIEDSVLLNWITEAMMACNTFNFVNYNKVINSVDIYYTKEGYNSYKDAITNARIIDEVVQKKLVLKASPTDAPQVLLEKPFAGRYMWKIKIPMQFRYQSVGFNSVERMDITLIVMRVPTAQSANGISILKFDIERLQN